MYNSDIVRFSLVHHPLTVCTSHSSFSNISRCCMSWFSGSVK